MVGFEYIDQPLYHQLHDAVQLNPPRRVLTNRERWSVHHVYPSKSSKIHFILSMSQPNVFAFGLVLIDCEC